MSHALLITIFFQVSRFLSAFGKIIQIKDTAIYLCISLAKQLKHFGWPSLLRINCVAGDAVNCQLPVEPHGRISAKLSRVSRRDYLTR